MYRRISELIVRVTELAEAEGRMLRAIVSRVTVGVGGVLVAALLAGAGLVLASWAVNLWLRPVLGEAGAAMATGVLALAVAGGVLWGAIRSMR